MEKRRFESFEVFSCLKKVNPRILSTFKRYYTKKVGKKPSSHIIHSLRGEYCVYTNYEYVGTSRRIPLPNCVYNRSGKAFADANADGEYGGYEEEESQG